MNGLNKDNVVDLFGKMDDFLASRRLVKSFLLIGGVLVVHLGMPERSTMDVDFYSNQVGLKPVLEDMATSLGLLFDPDEHVPDRVYLQWVEPDLVHMPKSDGWLQDVETAWQGRALTVLRPPVGVVIGSKLAVAREKDISDVVFIASVVPSWRSSLEKYLPMFSDEDRVEIASNLVYVDLLSPKDDCENSSVLSPGLPRHGVK